VASSLRFVVMRRSAFLGVAILDRLRIAAARPLGSSTMVGTDHSVAALSRTARAAGCRADIVWHGRCASADREQIAEKTVNRQQFCQAGVARVPCTPDCSNALDLLR